MFFVLSKLFGLVVQPINFLVLIGLGGLVLCATRLAGVGRAIMATAVLLWAVICFAPVGALMLRPLEDRFPQPPADMPAPSGIIVLGGSLDADIGAARGQPTMGMAAARLTTGVALSFQFPNARLIFTGGASDVRQKGLDEAQGVRRLWLSMGVPANRMVFEDASRNTYENATMTRALIDPKPGERWLLVTSAAHMPRSVGIFRRNGWSVVPYPVDYRTYGDRRDLKLSAAGLDALEKVDIALHEWLGLVAYRLTGKTDALFPSP